MGQRAEVMIKLGYQYYDAEDASIDYEWAVVITFASQALQIITQYFGISFIIYLYGFTYK